LNFNLNSEYSEYAKKKRKFMSGKLGS